MVAAQRRLGEARQPDPGGLRRPRYRAPTALDRPDQGWSVDRYHHPQPGPADRPAWLRSEEHTSELQSRENLVCRLLLDKNKSDDTIPYLGLLFVVKNRE